MVAGFTLAVGFQVTTFGQVVHTRASITKQYKLVLVKGQWYPTTGKVTVGLSSHWPSVTDLMVNTPTA